MQLHWYLRAVRSLCCIVARVDAWGSFIEGVLYSYSSGSCSIMLVLQAGSPQAALDVVLPSDKYSTNKAPKQAKRTSKQPLAASACTCDDVMVVSVLGSSS
eukprot:8123-Heterococcus_DN1.PRE.2